MNGLTRGSAAIVGAAESDIGAVAANMSPLDLMAQGIHRALADCGLKLKDVDGLFCATTQARTSAMSLCEYLRLPTPTPTPPSSAARRSRCMSRTRRPRWPRGCARSR